MKRECGSCTKCCEGWLHAKIGNYEMHKGKPCHFISINKGCTIYAKRPHDPCVTFKCEWLQNADIPEWMKPNEIQAIFKTDAINNIPYLNLREAGKTLDSRVLTWAIQYAITNNINLCWEVENSEYWLGSLEFNEAMSAQSKGKFRDQAPTHLPLV